MNILFINAAVRKNSRTNLLANYVLEKLNRKYNECNINVLNLNEENIQALNATTLQMRDDLILNNDFSHEMFKYAKQFNQADIVLICAPYWDLAFPANLKNYLEQIAVQGINFEYIHGIPSSFCNIKKLFYVSTSGGPMSLEFGFNYVKTLAENFYGIKENILFKAEFLDLRNANVDDILTKAKEVIDQYFEKEEA